MDSKGVVFPLKGAYDKANFTMEGRNQAAANVDPLLAPDNADATLTSTSADCGTTSNTAVPPASADTGTALEDIYADGTGHDKLHVNFRVDMGAAMCRMSQKGGPSNDQVVLRITRDWFTNEELERLEHPMTKPHGARYPSIPDAPRDVVTELYY